MSLFFFSAFLSLLWLKDIKYILSAILVLWFVDIKKVPKLSKKAFKSILFFNLGVSLGYLISAYFRNLSPWHYIIYINLKVFMLTYFVFLFFSKVSIVKVFGVNKDLRYLLTMTLSQIFSYKKSYSDFRDAFRVRVVSLRDKEKRFIIRVFEFFLKKAMKDSKERTLAMKARGFFEN